MVKFTNFNRVLQLSCDFDDTVGELFPLFVVREDFIQPAHVWKSITPLLIFLEDDEIFNCF